MKNEEKAQEIANNCATHIVGAEVSNETYINTEPDCYKAAMEMAKWKDEHPQVISCGKILQLRRGAYKKGYDKAIEKACEWLKNNMYEGTSEQILSKKPYPFMRDFINELTKAMEE